MTADLLEKVLAQTKTVNGCWEWQGATDRGYGFKNVKLGAKRSNTRVHRLVYILLFGQPKHCVCHRCDNRKCCNPAHLFSGTHKENMADMKAKGRARSPKGGASGNAILTEDEVRQIRTLRLTGISYAQLGRNFGVSKDQARLVCLRKCWAHVA